MMAVRTFTRSGLLIYTGWPHNETIAMHIRENRAKKGQSAIEYLTTYGWAILIIGVVIAFLASQGVFSSCQESTPRFGGEPATINSWAFTGINAISVSVGATNEEVTLEHVLLDYDQDGTYDATFPNTGTYGDSLSPGGSGVTKDLDTGSQFSAGECASMDVGLNVTISELDRATIATGSGVMQDTVPQQ